MLLETFVSSSDSPRIINTLNIEIIRANDNLSIDVEELYLYLRRIF